LPERGAGEGAVVPGLAENGGFRSGGNGVVEGLGVGSEHDKKSRKAGLERRALFVADRILVDAGLFAPEIRIQ